MEGGGTKIAHLQRIESQTGKEQIPDFEIPIEGQHLWYWFWDLSGRRPQGFGTSLIPYSEIEAWKKVRKILVYDWEIELLINMDKAFLQARHDMNSQKKN